LAITPRAERRGRVLEQTCNLFPKGARVHLSKIHRPANRRQLKLGPLDAPNRFRPE
jgi:hypothetical protein